MTKKLTEDATITNEAFTSTGDDENCKTSGHMSAQGPSGDENIHNVMIYQSMSGDADVGTSELAISGGSLTGLSGDMFYVTNTHALLKLENVELNLPVADANGEAGNSYLLNVCGNSASRGWGTAGANGAQLEFAASNQQLDGDIVVDSISTLAMTLSDGSVFTGTLNVIDNAQGGAAVADNAVVTVETGCTWSLTGDCTISSLSNNGTIEFNGHTITLADGTVLS